jgi:transposase
MANEAGIDGNPNLGSYFLLFTRACQVSLYFQTAVIREKKKLTTPCLQPSFDMVYRQISADMKTRALQLLEDGWEKQDIADALGVSPISIDRWHDNYQTQGRVDPVSYLRCRRRILSADVIEDLRNLIQESPGLYLDEIGIWLALYHDVQISTTALHDNLREFGLTHKLVRRAAAERDHELRTNWMYDVLNTYTAEQMVILDESSKDDRTLIRKYGRAISNNDPLLTVSLDRGTRYSILPALTLNGYIAARAVEGFIDGEEIEGKRKEREQVNSPGHQN